LVRTLPLDRRPRRRRLRNFTIAAVAMAAVMAGTALWLFSPIERIPVAVAPVANQTGYTELEPYRLALTQTLIDELSDSRHIRVLPYQRLLQIVRGFLPGGADPSSREVIQAVARHSAARLVIVPTLIRENSGWRARAEFRSADTATNAAVYETDPVVSSLVKDTAYALTSSLADGIREHFTATGPRKVRITDTMRRMAGYKLAPAAHRMRTLDAAMAFEQGVNAYDQLEFAAARRFFTSAAEQDPRDPLARAWLARAAQLVRQDDGAQEAATRAAPLVTAETPDRDAVLVAAVTAEARRDVATAEARYRDLMARYPDEPMWLVELASFQDRQTRTSDAIAGYRQALELDSRMPRPYLELCRLYNRLNESASAKEEGERALSAYRALGNRGGEAQALMCLTDMLRLGDDKQRVEARRDAEAALKIFQELGYAYNVARAQYYIALAAEAQGRPAEAVAVYEKSLASARDAGNVVLEPLVLMNLGAMQGKLGKQSSALDFHQQSHTLYEKFGDEQRAAQNQANVGAILIEYGGRSEEGLRDVQNALGVFRKVGDKTFEMFAAKVTATHDRYAGRHAEAERELNRAIALAREWGMEREIPALMIAIARSRFDMSDYAAARENLLRALEDGSGKDSVEARILLGLTHVRLGQFDRAQADLSQALRDVQKGGDTGHLPLLDTAMGELAYESGRPRDARIYYGEASALWTDDLPDPASVQARASLGLLDGLAGRPAAARAAILASLEHARRTGPLSLEARCRVHLARIDVAAQDFEDALNTLSAITTHRERALGPELQAQVHYWRSRALRGRGDRARAESEEGVARKLIKDLRASLPQQYQDGFAARADIHRVIE
jgi:tetratricopeptide (TPR) repeat protein